MSKQNVTPEQVDEPEIQITQPKAEEKIDVTPQDENRKVVEQKSLNDEKIEKLHRRMEYQARQFEKAMEEIRNLGTKIASAPQPQPVQQQPSNDDDVDVIASQDWKKGVKMVVTPEIERTVEAVLEKREKERLEKEAVRESQAIREKSMAKVYESHPEIEDEESDFTRIYTQVVNEDRSLLSNPLGPELAMHRAERLMKSNDRIKVDQGETQTERVARIKSTYVTAGRQPSGEGRIILTAEEKRICDEKGIKYSDYTKMRGMTSNNFKEGVSVDE